MFLGSRPDYFAPVQVQAFTGVLLRRFLGKTVKNLLQIGERRYVHNRFTRGDGTRCACTELFLSLGLEEKAKIEFALKDCNNFRLTRFADKVLKGQHVSK